VYGEDEYQEEEEPCPLEDLDPQDLEAIAVIYDNIRQLRRQNAAKMKGKGPTDKQMANDFDAHLQAVMGKLTQDMEACESPGDLGKGTYILESKVKLVEILITKFREYLT
jgi:hypothetical protein